MRTFKNLLWAILPIFALTFAVGCEDPQNNVDEPINPTKDSTLTLSKNKVDVGVAGGDFLLEYSIENPHQGEKISAEAAEPWVNSFNYGISGALGFKVDANTGSDVRECLVTVKYRYAEDVVFVVKQGAKTDAGFELENVTPDFFEFVVDVIPSDKRLPYIVMSASQDYIIDNEFTTGEHLYYDDIAYFEWMGSFYGETFVDIMNVRAKVGDQRGIVVGKGAAGMPYQFYCYYFDDITGALASDVAMFPITTKKPEKIAATFTADVQVDGCVVSVDVTPEGGYNGAYYFDMLNGLMVDYYLEAYGSFLKNPEDVTEFYWSKAVQEMMFLNSDTMSSADIINTYNCQGTWDDGSPRSQYDFELLANHTYYLVAFAMDEHGLCCSTPYIQKVETGSVAMSDNEITADVSNVTAQTATISFTTTNDDYYIAGWEKASDWATYGSTDAERQKYLLENISYEYISGDHSQGIIGLEPNTDYVLYAFGSRGGVATTSYIATATFTTRSISGGLASIEIKNSDYFIAHDVAELPGFADFGSDYYAGKLIRPLEYEITGEWSAFWIQSYIWTNRQHEIYNDKQYRDGLVWHIDQYGSMNTSKTYTVLELDNYYEFVGLVVDKNGDYSDISKVIVETSYDGANPNVQEYADWWNGVNDGPDLQSLSTQPLFTKKVARGAKYSQSVAVEAEREVPAADQVIVKR